MNNTLIVLLGPTGVGKTDLCIKLAEKYNSEIISADSRQFFREMSIGTAVPTARQLGAVKHHFIQFLSVTDYYSSNIFEKDVLILLPQLFIMNQLIFMSGGSGLYLDAVCHGIDEIPDTDPVIREKYKTLYRDEGVEGLRSALKILDPEHYARVDLKNHKRLMRALEICESSGMPYSSFLKKERRNRDFKVIKIGLKRDREDLYARINSRVDMMIAGGLEDEVRSLIKYRDLNALNSVGYREFFEFIDGKISYDKAVDLIKRNSRRYAKRQLTWWAKDNDIRWFYPENIKEIISYIDESMKPSANL